MLWLNPLIWVFLLVILFLDLLIDKLQSTQLAESWVGHKLRVLCAVRVPPGGTSAKFSWMHTPSNRTIARQFHDDTRSKSYLTIMTYKDEDFEAPQCRAETKATVKFHIIDVTKLSGWKMKIILNKYFIQILNLQKF